MSSSRKDKTQELSRRERQIMDVLYRLGKASAAEIREGLADPPTYTAVRTHLTILQEKGHVKYEVEGQRYVYEPIVPRDEMARSAIQRVMSTFFDNSVERVMAALLEKGDTSLSQEQLDRLSVLIEEARTEGR